MNSQNSISGLALRGMTPSISPAAGLIRAMDVVVGPKYHPLSIQPRNTFDQLESPCCVSCASASAMECLDANTPQLSPLFLYYLTEFDRIPLNSNGTLTLQEAVNTMTFKGIAALDLYDPPFTDTGIRTKPKQDAYLDGAKRALGRRGLAWRYTFFSGPSFYQWARGQLQQQRPILLAIRQPESYPDTFLDSNNMWSDPTVNATSIAHCILVTGFHDVFGLRVHDSRGPRFDQGEWWMSPRVADSSFIQGAVGLIP